MLTKTGFMKKFFPFIIFVLSSLAANAQTASFTLATTPCHNDGVLNANFTGLTAPLTVSWQTYGTAGTIITHTGVTGLSDALTDYSGGPVFVSAIDIHGLSASNSFAGVPPITISCYMPCARYLVCSGMQRRHSALHLPMVRCIHIVNSG